MAIKPTSAMVFAAGFGTRMGDLTKELPKPMLPLAGRPMVDHTLDLLRAAGIKRIVANTHYLHDRIAPHLTDQGVITNHEEGEILDTGGGLRAALPLLHPGPVITMNPDAAWRGPNPVDQLLSSWNDDMDALLLVVPHERAVARTTPGDFDLTDNRLSRRGEYVYTGLQIVNPALLDRVTDPVFSLNRVWDTLIAEDALFGAIYPGKWCDIGHPEGLAAAEALIRGEDV